MKNDHSWEAYGAIFQVGHKERKISSSSPSASSGAVQSAQETRVDLKGIGLKHNVDFVCGNKSVFLKYVQCKHCLTNSDSDKKKVKKEHDAPVMTSSKRKRLFGRERPVHQVFGGGKPADVFLWRNKKISAGVLAGATALWVLFELLEYHLVTLVSYVLILVIAVLFLWSNACKFINRSPPTIPEVKIPEDTLRQVVGAVRIEVNNFLGMLRDVASGRDLKKFLAVVAGLWVLSIVGSWCNFLTLFYITFVALLTVPVLYEKYEDQVDAYAEKAMIEFKKQYAVFDAKVLSRIPKGPLKGKKKD